MAWRMKFTQRKDRTARSSALVGLLLLIVAFAAQQWAYEHGKYVPITGDMVHYNHAADMLLLHHVFTYWGLAPAAQVMPGYPLFLAGCKWLAGAQWIAGYGQFHLAGLRFVVHVQSFLCVLETFLVYAIARRVCDRKWSTLAAVLWALYLPLGSAATMLLTETLYTFLLWGFIWLAIRAAERPTVLRWCCSGLALGLCTLVRPTPLPLLAVIGLYLLWRWRAGRTHFLQAVMWFAACAVSCIVVLVPWWIRNWRVFHKVILTSNDAGNPLLYGSVPPWAHFSVDITGLTPQQQEALALHNIRLGFSGHPWLYIKWYTVDKLSKMFGAPWYPHDAPLQWWADAHLLWIAMGVVGLATSLRAGTAKWLVCLTAILVVVQLPFIPLPRYAFPIMPVFFIGTGFLAQNLMGWWKHSRSERAKD